MPAWGRTQVDKRNILRVPYADFNCLHLPDDADEKETDYVMLSDIFPTGWHSTRLADLKPGESILIYGAGPVGLMAAMSARIQGASQIFVVDGQPDRLALAKKIGATPIDYEGRRYRRSDSRTHQRPWRGLRGGVHRLPVS